MYLERIPAGLNDPLKNITNVSQTDSFAAKIGWMDAGNIAFCMYCLHMLQYTFSFRQTQLPSFKRILWDSVDRLGQVKLINSFYRMLVIFMSASLSAGHPHKVTSIPPYLI